MPLGDIFRQDNGIFWNPRGASVSMDVFDQRSTINGEDDTKNAHTILEVKNKKYTTGYGSCF